MLTLRSKLLSRLGRALGRDAGLALEKSRLEQSLAQLTELEGRLRESEARYRTFAEQLPLVTYMDELNEASSSIYISPQVETILGYAPEEWLTDPELFPKLLHPDDRERVLAEHVRAHASGESFSTEYRLISRDGRVVWFHDEVTIARDETGEPLHTQGFLVDVTERKRQHQELAALHETALGLVERLDTESVLHTIAVRAGALVGTSHCYLYLAEPGSDELTVRLGTGVFDDFVGYRLRRGEGLGGRVWESEEPLAVDDYHEWSGRRRDLDDQPFRAVVGVPLRSGSTVIGVLGLAYVEQGRT
ncbi:MAG: PAS domain-containing protein, partial [Gaiellaceae bacterium]